jgi:hypothetical protein
MCLLIGVLLVAIALQRIILQPPDGLYMMKLSLVFPLRLTDFAHRFSSPTHVLEQADMLPLIRSLHYRCAALQIVAVSSEPFISPNPSLPDTTLQILTDRQTLFTFTFFLLDELDPPTTSDMSAASPPTAAYVASILAVHWATLALRLHQIGQLATVFPDRPVSPPLHISEPTGCIAPLSYVLQNRHAEIFTLASSVADITLELLVDKARDLLQRTWQHHPLHMLVTCLEA